MYVLALPIGFAYILIPSGSLLMQVNGGWPYITYLWFTVLGFFAVSDQGLQDRIRQMRWISLAAGLALVVGFAMVRSGIAHSDVLTPRLMLAGLMRIFGGWLVVLAILGLGMQYLTGRSARLDYANEAVPPFYILHQTVIVTVGYFVLGWGIPDLLEWATIGVISFITIMTVYEYLVRRWNVMRFLFGMKPLPPRPAAEAMRPRFGGAARAREMLQ